MSWSHAKFAKSAKLPVIPLFIVSASGFDLSRRRGDFVGFRQFSERGSIHLLGEGSSPSVWLNNPASSFENSVPGLISAYSAPAAALREKPNEGSWGYSPFANVADFA